MFSADIKSHRMMMDAFSTEEACIKYLELKRWNGNVTSPFVENGEAWKCKNGKYICKTTKKYFTVRNGTMFEKSKISLRDWFSAMWMMMETKKGISSCQLAVRYGITQSTAWKWSMKLRTFLNKPIEPKNISKSIKKLSGIVEADEAFFGGKNNKLHRLLVV